MGLSSCLFSAIKDRILVLLYFDFSGMSKEKRVRGCLGHMRVKE